MFKKGDIVICKENNKYKITNNNCICRVEKNFNNQCISISIVEFLDSARKKEWYYNDLINREQTYTVLKKHFKSYFKYEDKDYNLF